MHASFNTIKPWRQKNRQTQYFVAKWKKKSQLATLAKPSAAPVNGLDIWLLLKMCHLSFLFYLTHIVHFMVLKLQRTVGIWSCRHINKACNHLRRNCRQKRRKDPSSNHWKSSTSWYSYLFWPMEGIPQHQQPTTTWAWNSQPFC